MSDAVAAKISSLRIGNIVLRMVERHEIEAGTVILKIGRHEVGRITNIGGAEKLGRFTEKHK